MGLAVAGHFGRPARTIAFHDEQFGAFAVRGRTIHQLTRQTQALGGGFALRFFFLSAAQALFGAQDQKIEDRPRRFGIGGQPIVKAVAHRPFDHARRFGGGEAVFGLPDKFGFGDKA